MLTAKQENFCKNIAKGMTQYDAYKDAYDTNTDDRDTVDNDAYKTAKKPEVAARIEELRNIATKDVKITLEKLLNELEEVKLDAKGDQDRANTIKAIQEQGKLVGLYVTKTENKDVDKFSEFLSKVKEETDKE